MLFRSDRAGGSVKTAIVMQKRAVDREAALALLSEANGRIRSVVPGPPPPAR